MQAGSHPSYPELRRARGYRLYTRKGARLLDFYQDDGRAFLGHDPKGVSRAMKAEIDRGLHAAGPSPHMRRLQRELSTLWQVLASQPASGVALLVGDSGRDWAVFRNREQYAQALGTRSCVLWRPGLALGPFGAPAPGVATTATTITPADTVVEMQLPLPGACTPVVAGFPHGAASIADTTAAVAKAVAVNQHCSPVQLAGLHRVVNLLRSDPRVLGGRVTYDTLEAAWTGLNTPLFVRHGAYLQPRVQHARYGALHQAMVERGFFLNPSSHGLSIIPGECSAGEFAGFSRACKELKEFADVS